MVQVRRTRKAGFITGLVVGVPLGALLVWGLWQRAHSRAESKWAPAPVLVAARELPLGHLVGPADLVEASFPAVLVTSNCATPATRARFEGRTLRWAVAAGAIVRETDLVAPSPSCAARARATGARLGLDPADTLVSTLVSKHGGAP